jgi:hypothetical protein
MMATYYGTRPVVVTGPNNERTVEPFDFKILKDMWLHIKIDVGNASYFSEVASVQTLDNLLNNGMIEFVEYLKRIPDEIIPNKQELITSIEQQDLYKQAIYNLMGQFMDRLDPETRASLMQLNPEQMEKTVLEMMGALDNPEQGYNEVQDMENPMPTDEEFPFNFDCATSIVQNGKIEFYERMGKETPANLVITKDGGTMTESGEILKQMRAGNCALLSIGGAGEETGGYKGYGFTTIVEILSAALAGGPYMKALSGKELLNRTFSAEQPGWYHATMKLKRVMAVEGAANKFCYVDTVFEAKLKAHSVQDCYNRVIDHLRTRADLDPRSQFPSIRGRNFNAEFLGID